MTKVRGLFPASDPVPVSQTDEFVEEDFTTEDVLDALHSFPKRSSGGLGGLMADHLVGEGPMFAQASTTITSIVSLTSAFAWNRLPHAVSALIVGAKPVLLRKKDLSIDKKSKVTRFDANS